MCGAKERSGYIVIPLDIMQRDDLSNVSKLVYGALLYHAKYRHGEFPTQRNLAWDCGLDRAQVNRALRQMTQRGILTRVKSTMPQQHYKYILVEEE